VYFTSAGNYPSRTLHTPVPFASHLFIDLAGAIFGGAFMARFVEVLMLRLRDWHFPSRLRDNVVRLTSLDLQPDLT
jgi:hypothetical protein